MKRTISMLLTFAMILTLCACGKKSGDSWQEQYDLGVRYLSEGNYEEAVIAFTAAIEIDPKRPEAFLGRGSAYIGAGETAENLAAAQADYEKALELDDTNAEAYLGLADVYIRQGEYDKAMELLRQALEKLGDDPDISDKLAELESDQVADSSGNIRRRSHYNGSGALIGYFTYTYDADGSQKTVTAYDAAGNQVDFGENIREFGENTTKETLYTEMIEPNSVWLQRVDSEYTDNEDGSSVEEQVYYDKDGSVLEHGRNYYDSEHRCIRMESYDLDGSLLSYNTFEYNESGQEARYNQYMADGSLAGYTVAQYDGNGNMTRSESYDADGQLRYYTVNTFDENGNPVSSESYDGDGTLRYSSVSG